MRAGILDTPPSLRDASSIFVKHSETKIEEALA